MKKAILFLLCTLFLLASCGEPTGTSKPEEKPTTNDVFDRWRYYENIRQPANDFKTEDNQTILCKDYILDFPRTWTYEIVKTESNEEIGIDFQPDKEKVTIFKWRELDNTEIYDLLNNKNYLGAAKGIESLYKNKYDKTLTLVTWNRINHSTSGNTEEAVKSPDLLHVFSILEYRRVINTLDLIVWCYNGNLYCCELMQFSHSNYDFYADTESIVLSMRPATEEDSKSEKPIEQEKNEPILDSHHEEQSSEPLPESAPEPAPEPEAEPEPAPEPESAPAEDNSPRTLYKKFISDLKAGGIVTSVDDSMADVDAMWIFYVNDGWYDLSSSQKQALAENIRSEIKSWAKGMYNFDAPGIYLEDSSGTVVAQSNFSASAMTIKH